MDLRTGKTYESLDAAIADGVPEADIVDASTGDPLVVRERWPAPAPNREQGQRERERRMARMK